MRCILFLAALLFVPMLAHGEQPTIVPSTQPSDRAERTWHESIRPSTSTEEQERVSDRVATASVHDDKREPFEVDRADAFQLLLETETFASRAVGYHGYTSRQAFAFQILMKQPDALPIFEDLLDRAGLPGQLYALSAIGLLAPDRFAAAAKPFETMDVSVSFLGGCVGSHLPVNIIVKHFPLADGSYANELLGKPRSPK